jgi:hypothetical protein
MRPEVRAPSFGSVAVVLHSFSRDSEEWVQGWLGEKLLDNFRTVLAVRHYDETRFAFAGCERVAVEHLICFAPCETPRRKICKCTLCFSDPKELEQ